MELNYGFTASGPNRERREHCARHTVFLYQSRFYSGSFIIPSLHMSEEQARVSFDKQQCH